MNMSSANVEILLLTYNQRPLLDDLLRSLVAQTHPDWRIIARDDGSSDGTLGQLMEFSARHPQRMKVLVEDRARNLGIVEGFSRLLQAGAAPYSMLCDCDDVWLPHKVEQTLAYMKQLERRRSPETPLLVHTDLRVTDSSLATVSDSFLRHQNLDPRRGRSLNRLLVQNCITGCTVMINKPLRELSLPIPPEAAMHDWWLALVAAAFGTIGFAPEPTILYRQHKENAIGAREWNAPYVLQKLRRFRDDTQDLRRSLETTARQAEALLARYQDKLDRDQRRILSAYISLPRAGWFSRRARILRYRLFKHGLIRNVSWVARA